MITYEFDPNTLAKVERKLGSLKSEAPKALKTQLTKPRRQPGRTWQKKRRKRML